MIVATNPKGRVYFQKLFSKLGGSTPQVVVGSTPQARREVEVVESIPRVEAILDVGDVVVEPLKKSRENDKSSNSLIFHHNVIVMVSTTLLNLF